MSGRIGVIELLDTGITSKHIHKYIRDPIHIYIPFTKLEENVIDSVIFQRLRRIHQLQIAYTVYPGATHSRFLHSIGVMHLAGKFALALLRTSHAYAGQKAPRVKSTEICYYVPWFEDMGLSGEQEILSSLVAVRLGGLLHDVGHMPYSHAFDEAIISRSKEIRKIGISSHEDTSYYIYKNFVWDIIKKSIRDYYGGSPIDCNIVRECLDHIMMPRRDLDKPKLAIYGIMRHVVKEFVYPADILDFCMRDSYFTGAVEYGRIDVDRLFVGSIILEREYGGNGKAMPYIGLMKKAIGALRAFLYSRLWLFNNVYFHKFSRLMDYTVKELLMELYDKNIINFEEIYEGIVRGDDEIIEKLEKMDDGYILYKALESGDGKLKELARRILYRKPYLKEIYSQEITILQSDIEQYKGAEGSFDEVIGKLKDRISEALNLNPESIIIDSPPIKFFPLNPYLPYSMFPLITVEKHKIVSVQEADAWIIASARITDLAVLRILVPRHIINAMHKPDEEIRREIESIISKEFEKKIKAAFIAKYSKFKYEVTM